MNNKRFENSNLAAYLVLALSYLFFAANLLRPRLLLMGDSGSQQRFFHYVYSQFFIHGDLVEWMPDAGFGTNINFLHLFFMPSPTYLMLVVGKLASIRDAFLAFKLSIAVEGFVLLCGMYILLRAFAIRRLAAAIMSTVPLLVGPYLIQHAFGFSDVHMLPLVLFFFLKAFRDRSVTWFWGGAILGLFGCRGYASYTALVFIYVTIAFNLYLVFRYRGWKTPLPRNSSGWIVAGLFLVLAIMNLIQYANVFEGFNVILNERNADGRVRLQTFLTYAGVYSLRSLAESLFTGVRDLDPNLYAGVLTLFFAIYAQFGKNRQIARVATIFFAGLLAFSLGGAFSIFYYHLPLMNIFRHLRFVHTFLSFFLVIVAAFGLNKFLAGLAAGDPARGERLRKYAKISLAVFFGLIFLNDLLYPGLTIHSAYNPGTTWVLPVRWLMVLLVASLPWSEKTSRWRTAAPLIIAGAFLLDLGYYNTSLHRFSRHARYLPGYYQMRNVRPMLASPYSRKLNPKHALNEEYTGYSEYLSIGAPVWWRPDADAERLFGEAISQLHSPHPDLAKKLRDSEKIRAIAEELVSPSGQEVPRIDSAPVAAAKILLQPCTAADVRRPFCHVSVKVKAYEELWKYYILTEMRTQDFSRIPRSIRMPSRPFSGYNSHTRLYSYDMAFFRDLDPCTAPGKDLRWDAQSDGYLFLRTNLGKDHPFLNSITGCRGGLSWVRFPEEVVVTRDFADHWSHIKSNADAFSESSPDVLHVMNPDAPRSFQNVKIENAKENHVLISKYSGNQVEFVTGVPSSQGAYLYWADSFHPGWKAFVDGEQVPMLRANMGYKAILVPQGDHKVRFIFDNGSKSIATRFNAIASAIFVLFLIPFLILRLRKT